MLLSVALFIVSFPVALLLLCIKRKIRREVKKACESEEYSKPYLQQLCTTYALYLFWIKSVLGEIAKSDTQINRQPVPNRIRAIEGLADIDGHEVKKLLFDLSQPQNNSERTTRSAAVQGLAKLKTVDVKDCLFNVLRDEDQGVITSAVTGLQKFSDSGTLQKLYPLLSHDNDYVRGEVMDTIRIIIGDMEPPDTEVTEHAMKALLDDSDDDVRCRAVNILEHIRRIGALETAYDQLASVESPPLNILKEIGDAIIRLKETSGKEE